MRMSCKSVSDNAEDEMAIWSSSSCHYDRNDLSSSESHSNTDSLSQSVYENAPSHVRATKVIVDSRSTSSERNGNSDDVATLVSLKLPPMDFNLQKKPLIEVIEDSNKRIRLSNFIHVFYMLLFLSFIIESLEGYKLATLP